MPGIICHLFCTVTGKAYVGQTWQRLDVRWLHHQKPSSQCIKLQRAIRKYGPSRFVRSILTSGLTTQEQMDAAEKYWIQYFDCQKEGYNLKEGGSYGKHSEASKAKMSLSQRGITKPGVAKAMLGNKFNLGRKLYGVHREAVLRGLNKAVEAAKSRKSRVSRSRSRGVLPFICLESGVTYEMVADAAQALDLDPSALSKALRGTRLKSTGGYHFRYIESPNLLPVRP